MSFMWAPIERFFTIVISGKKVIPIAINRLDISQYMFLSHDVILNNICCTTINLNSIKRLYALIPNGNPVYSYVY